MLSSKTDSMYHGIYSEMRSRNLNNITGGGKAPPTFNIDTKMGHHTYRAGGDHRRCLSMYSFPNITLSPTGRQLFNELNDLFSHDPSVVLFSPSPPSDTSSPNIWGRLHWTLMQIQGFNSYTPQTSPNANETFGKCIQTSFQSAPEIHVRLTGIIAVGTGLVMVGLPSYDVNSLRDTVRESVKSGECPGYDLKEPFVNDICHSTVLRLTGDGDGGLAEKVLDIARRYGEADLGSMKVDRVNVGEASWRMMDAELEKTPAFWSWKIGGEEEELTTDESEEDENVDVKAGGGRTPRTPSGSDDSQSTSFSESDSETVTPQPATLRVIRLEDVGWK
ncbi:hypothetical protein TrVE_jg4103 [Triparma verrucosa]|uniref:Uncharacterized protein n=1 Tax=Triparma verrucosa TaxID=1606542 RepID=A0A9W7C5H9_9STRA|nr:hypothetical protein TrVE_jg4103 [Triparma verrucosa]